MNNGYACILLAGFIRDNKEEELLYEKAFTNGEKNIIRNLYFIYYTSYEQNKLEINITNGELLKELIQYMVKASISYLYSLNKNYIDDFTLSFLKGIKKDKIKEKNLIDSMNSRDN